MRQTFVFIALITFLGLGCSQRRPVVKWTFAASGKVLSHPVVEGNTVFFGSDDKSFYAVDIHSGKELWRHSTRSEIRGTALIENDMAYVVSGNDVYALDKSTGKEIWTFLNPNSKGAERIDKWDYHTGVPVLYESTLYVGLGDGHVYGLDAATGTVITQFATADTAAVRGGLLVDRSTLYFGDWNGKVYAYDLRSGKQIWRAATFDERPYATFGPVNSTLAVSGDLLFFGARNPEVKVLNKLTGEKRWSYIEKEGGWISGDPLVQNDTLFIGSSDNHEMFAFDAVTGRQFWVFEFLYNNFSKPLSYRDVLLFTTGDAYTVWGTTPGRGYLYAVERSTGNLRTLFSFGGNLHTSPVLKDGLLLVGSEDYSLYAVDLDAFLSAPFSQEDLGYDAVTIKSLGPNPFDNESEITYTVNYPAAISVSITDIGDSTLVELFAGDQAAGEHSVRWDGKDAGGEEVEDGYYFVKVSSKDFYRKTFIQKKNE